MNSTFEMVAKTFRGLEDVLAEELRGLGASDVMPGNRMVSFSGDKAMLYKANMCCRTALRVLKPIYKFRAADSDELYERVRDFDWSTLLSPEKTFAIDTVAFGEEFTHSRFVTYRVKDAVVDWFRDRHGNNCRPQVRLDGADINLNVHVAGDEFTISLDSSGESLHRRGYRSVQTDAPINEVLAAGIILISGWRGDVPFVDPMCGSGTFLIEAALIAANINPGVFRKHYAFENWPDFDRELFESIYNDDSGERDINVPIIGADIAAQAVEITMRNAKSAGVARWIRVERRDIADWSEAPQPAGVLISNPPYGERISAPDMEGLYRTIGRQLKHVFRGYHAWIIGYRDEYFHEIGLAPSQKIALNNGGLECELREYVIFEGSKRDFRAGGGRIKEQERRPAARSRREHDTRRGDKDSRDGFRKRRDRDNDKREFRGRRENGEKRDERRRDERQPRHFGRGDEQRRERDFKKRDGRERSFDRRSENVENLGSRSEDRRHRPIDLNRIGRGPQLSADKEIVVNRPVWRRRKSESEETD
jgi:putative N6-adenine-specific DNA methylase